MENKSFTYTYSAARNKEVESIRKKYMPYEESKPEKLKRLDNRVRLAGTVEGLCPGIVGALVFGIGICFFLEVFTGAAWLTACLMICGVFFMISAYPIYRHVARKTRAQLIPEILRLSEEILNSKNFQD